MKVNEMI